MLFSFCLSPTKTTSTTAVEFSYYFFLSSFVFFDLFFNQRLSNTCIHFHALYFEPDLKQSDLLHLLEADVVYLVSSVFREKNAFLGIICVMVNSTAQMDPMKGDAVRFCFTTICTVCCCVTIYLKCTISSSCIVFLVLSTFSWPLLLQGIPSLFLTLVSFMSPSYPDFDVSVSSVHSCVNTCPSLYVD